MSSSEDAWLKLNAAVGATVHMCDLLRFYGGAEPILQLSKEELVRSGLCNVPLAEKIEQAKKTDVSEITEICRKNGWLILTPDSPLYPALLKDIKDFPLILFCSGKAELLNAEKSVSVVGTRKASDEALMATYLFAGAASMLGVTVISGGALGIDAAAHEGALIGVGGTVAVLGSGLGSDYLRQNELLRRRIVRDGVLITELLPYQKPSSFTFPRRNRIISGMSRATLVAQSGEKGGSMITADLAMHQGRDVYCFTENVVKSEGAEKLMRLGAKGVEVPGDLLNDFMFFPPEDTKADKYLHYTLKNDGILSPHIIKPDSMSPELYAAYNGVSPGEAAEILGNDGDTTAKPAKPKKTTAAKETESKPVTVPVKPGKEKAASAPNTKKGKKKSAAAPPPPKEKRTDLPAWLSESAVKIYGALERTPKNFDELQFLTQLPIQKVMAGVTELELEDLAVLHPGNRVSI